MRYNIDRIRLLPDNPIESYVFIGKSYLDAVNQFDNYLKEKRQLQVTDAGYDEKENNWKITVKSIDQNSFGFNMYVITEHIELFEKL